MIHYDYISQSLASCLSISAGSLCYSLCPLKAKNLIRISKHLFIIPTDAHNYKNHKNVKKIKLPIIALTCFGSRRNHHQGAISCLAKTTIMSLLCSSLMTWSMSWRHISLLCKRAIALLHNREMAQRTHR